MITERIHPDVSDAKGSAQSILRKGFQPLHSLIALKAYDIWEKRGRVEGFAVHDWLEAEKSFSDDIIQDHDLSTPNSQLCSKNVSS